MVSWIGRQVEVCCILIAMWLDTGLGSEDCSLLSLCPRLWLHLWLRVTTRRACFTVSNTTTTITIFTNITITITNVSITNVTITSVTITNVTITNVTITTITNTTVTILTITVLFAAVLRELIRDGEVAGALYGRADKEVYIPGVYTQSQNQWVDSFLASNGYLG